MKRNFKKILCVACLYHGNPVLGNRICKASVRFGQLHLTS